MSLEEVRAEISRVDSEIIRLIARRQALAGDVARVKAETGHPTHDAGRAEEVLRLVSREAEEAGVDPVPVRKIFETLIAMSEERQRELREEQEQGDKPGRM